MKRLFGTDGIRGVANQHPLDIETALKVGRAVAAFFDGRANGTGRVLIGRDTRISGDMLVSAIAAGICSMGKDVFLAGIIPTPAVAFLTAAEGFDAGIVISASHNPFYDNGIKLFDKDGYKLSDDAEANLEQIITDNATLYNKSNSIQKTGQVRYLDDALVRYQQFLANCYPYEGRPLEGMRLVVDCSNGAASRLAPALFEDLGATVRTMSSR